jgi:hypothetical protein
MPVIRREELLPFSDPLIYFLILLSRLLRVQELLAQPTIATNENARDQRAFSVSMATHGRPVQLSAVSQLQHLDDARDLRNPVDHDRKQHDGRNACGDLFLSAQFALFVHVRGPLR